MNCEKSRREGKDAKLQVIKRTLKDLSVEFESGTFPRILSYF